MIATRIVNGATADGIAGYRPGLYLVTAVALIGLVASVTAVLNRKPAIAAIA